MVFSESRHPLFEIVFKSDALFNLQENGRHRLMFLREPALFALLPSDEAKCRIRSTAGSSMSQDVLQRMASASTEFQNRLRGSELGNFVLSRLSNPDLSVTPSSPESCR